jgi:hypothetical protein
MKEIDLMTQIRDITSVLRDVNVERVVGELKTRGIKVKPNHVFRLLKSMAKEGLYDEYYFEGFQCETCGRKFSEEINKELMPACEFVHDDKSIPNHIFCNECYRLGKAECKR